MLLETIKQLNQKNTELNNKLANHDNLITQLSARLSVIEN
jgi:hypothetical protein